MVTIDELSLPLSMSDFDDGPILLANHFLIQHQPDEFVVSLARERDVQLISVCAHNHGPILGSISRGVVRNAPCPALVVREM
jgi:hypothetical protein